jgi:hypothetical protein
MLSVYARIVHRAPADYMTIDTTYTKQLREKANLEEELLLEELDDELKLEDDEELLQELDEEATTTYRGS